MEKWLQSPALSGLARKLFSEIVAEMQNIDPPLPEDVSAISSILSMTLKASQVRAGMRDTTDNYLSQVVAH